MTYTRSYHTATLLPNGRLLVSGGYGGGVGSTSSSYMANAEVYDPTEKRWLICPYGMSIYRAWHTATLLPNGKVLVAGGYDGAGPGRTADLYDPATNMFSATGAMAINREQHTATLLPNGKVLVAGGLSSTSLAIAELYDPATGTWSSAGTMPSIHSQHTATLLPDGKVLIVGGYGQASIYSRAAELYDPATNTWSTTGGLRVGRRYHTATLLPNGKVLVAGGYDPTVALSSAELYDPATGTWSPAGTMSVVRAGHTAALLPNGKVLLVGGYNTMNSSVYETELYDPETGTWTQGPPRSGGVGATATVMPDGQVMLVNGFAGALYEQGGAARKPAGSMTAARASSTATLLPDGQVLVVGGQGDSGALASAERVDPASGTWSSAGTMSEPRQFHTTTLLPDGRVLVSGGSGASQASLASVELYDPTSVTWSSTGALAEPRSRHTATLLNDGRVMVVGGRSGTGTPLASVELYDPETGTWSPTGPLAVAREGHIAVKLSTGKVLVAAGTGASGALTSAELYDPAAGTWSTVTGLTTARTGATAALLPNGMVLVASGQDSAGGLLASAERYDPQFNKWYAAGTLAAGRVQAVATSLLDGRVMVSGGYQQATGPGLTSVELYDAKTGTWGTSPASLAAGRSSHAAVLLPDGQVLVVGGAVGSSVLASAELFDGVVTNGAWRPTVSLPDTVIQGMPFTVSGTGLRGISEACSGTSGSSPSNTPVVRLIPVGGGAITRLGLSSISSTSLSAVMPLLKSDHYLLSVSVNGITGGRVIRVGPGPVSAKDLAFTTAEDTAWAVTLSARSHDGSPLTYTVVSNPAHGTLSGTAPDLTYTPAANYNGSDSFTYQASDGTNVSNVATVALTVTSVPDAPVAQNVTVVAGASAATPVGLVASDGDSNTLTYTVVSNPAHGTLSGSGSILTYNPASGYTGSDTFTYKASDGTLESGVATVTLYISSVASASYDTTLKAPRCSSPAGACDSGTLLNGIGNVGPEPNRPNTLAGSPCTDGVITGTYHYYVASLDRLKVSTLDGSALAPGKTAKIEATVWSVSLGNEKLDLYYSASTTSPSWIYIGTVSPTARDAQVLSLTYTLPSGSQQAVRGVFRYGGSPSTCVTSNYNDYDDLVFPVTTSTADVMPPTVSLTAPGAGTTLSGSVNVTASASDNVGVNRVAFYAGSTLLGTVYYAPYQVSWDTTAVANGSYTLSARAYDSAGNIGYSSNVTVTVNNAVIPPGPTATYNATLKAPQCATPGPSCDSGTLINGRAQLGPEPNQPNTLGGTCADGTGGSYHSDESLDRLRVGTEDGSAMAPGKTVKIEATAWVYSSYNSDKLDLYYAADASNPSWVYIGTITPTASGSRVLSATYTLPAGTMQAVRGVFRYGGSASSCPVGSFTDVDDLVFATQ
ncbi:cadherin-like domain-containing protein [Archangium violaceum]|uniref:kelch repeat-containing protein n=1 Tax=Archangium violaceum TaxID=83451 RepID=UPI001951AA24|nr:kelch repeat-containing protein [Archangium violaceum]QRN95901.1 cadherin-like domain-containing protein [Archangium violaceum]